MKHLTLALALLAVPAAAEAPLECDLYGSRGDMITEICTCSFTEDAVSRLACYDRVGRKAQEEGYEAVFEARALASTEAGREAMRRVVEGVDLDFKTGPTEAFDPTAIARSLAESERGRQAIREALELYGD